LIGIPLIISIGNVNGGPSNKKGGKYEDVYLALQRILQEEQEYREEEDADIEEEIRIMPIIHKVLEIEMEKEQQGRPQRDRLTEEEIQTVMKMELDKQKRETEIFYWMRIVALMSGGLAKEEAREKIYQDLVAKGDIKCAKLLRAMQDQGHPIKQADQMPP
jgi:hypothetical protein